jgi:hypothetical protein
MVILIHVSWNVELSSCNPISSDQVFLLRLWFRSAFRILRSILEIDHRGLVAVVARCACLTFREISTCLWTHPRLTRTNRGALWQNGGSKRRAFSESDGKPWFKESFMRLNMFTSPLLKTSTKAWSNLSRLVYLSPSISCYLWLSKIRFVFVMFFKIRCIGFTSWILGFIRSTLASHICSTDSIFWVHHSREEGSLDYDGGFVCLQVHLKFNTNNILSTQLQACQVHGLGVRLRDEVLHVCQLCARPGPAIRPQP